MPNMPKMSSMIRPGLGKQVQRTMNTVHLRGLTLWHPPKFENEKMVRNTKSDDTDTILTLSYPVHLRQRLPRTHQTYQNNRIYEGQISRANPSQRQRHNPATQGVAHAAQPLQTLRESRGLRLRNTRPSQHRHRRCSGSQTCLGGHAL